MRKDKAHFASSLSFVVFYGALMATLYVAVGIYVGDLHWALAIPPAAILVGGLISMIYFDKKWMW